MNLRKFINSKFSYRQRSKNWVDKKDRPRADALFCFHFISTFCFYQVMHVGTIALKRRRKDDDENKNFQ